MLPILYTFRRCPYAMRARMAIVVSGVEVEMREVVLRDKPPEMLILSPKGTVPVLVLPDGKVIDESLDIMHWALVQNDPQSWLDGVDKDLIAENDGPFKMALDRYKYPHRYGLEDGLEYREQAVLFLVSLDQATQEHGFLSSDHITFTDIAIFPFIRQFAATDPAWFDAFPLHALQGWLAGMVGSDFFDQVMQKHAK